MQVLRRAPLPAIFFLGLLLSCMAGGPLTPEDAFHDLRRSFASRDVVLFSKILSTASRAKMEEVLSHISSMTVDQKDGMAALYGISRERLEKLTFNDFCAIYITAQDRGPMGQTLRSGLVSRDQQGDRVIMGTAAGARFTFVKEGPYWKFDLTGL